ncbi:MAG: pyridoxal-phosphate dependent enzyme [Chlorobi bacterium]|nr:pyridoxal-phosphate dependent enzyme [Chlorobiota bacterium]
MIYIPDFKDIIKAEELIRPYIKRTPVMTCQSLNIIAGADIYFKCENFQKVGAFKFRGASNAVFSLTDEEAARGVATHSSGNHAQALALAAKMRGIKSYIVMPNNSPQVKKDAVAGYGAEIIFCEPTLEARESTLKTVTDKTGAIFIHPYDNAKVIAGQGTAAMELLDEIKNLDCVIAPVGGGGLLSGTALSVKALSPKTTVIAAEPEGADDAARSFKAGHIIPSVKPDTICDGLLTSLGERNFEIISNNVSDIITVSEPAIKQAFRLIWERMKIIVEPSSAVTLALVLEKKIDLRDKKIGLIISGGNVDLARLPGYLE